MVFHLHFNENFDELRVELSPRLPLEFEEGLLPGDGSL